MPKNLTTNAAWNKLFQKLDIASQLEDSGMFKISARKISDIARREPRLMSKFDQRKQRPEILRKHGVTILPLSNGEYALLKGDGYIAIPPPGPTDVVSYDAAHLRDIQSIPWRSGISSEPQAIDTLFMSSAIKSFAGDDSLLLTIRGKIRSRPFSFRFNTIHREHELFVDGPQIEIDSGYEGRLLVLIEAKFGAVEDSIVRQLYYPFRHWKESGIPKRILCVFLVYSNKVYSLYEFSFADPHQYQSASITRQKHFLLEDKQPIPTLSSVISSNTQEPPDDVPFPQADVLSKILDVVELLSAGPRDKFGIADSFDVDPRQGDYYANGAAWLGLVERVGGNFRLSDRGRIFFNLKRSERLAELARLVTRMPIFQDVARAWIHGEHLSAQQIASDLKKHFRLSDTTAERRALTVRSWIEWLSEQLGV